MATTNEGPRYTTGSPELDAKIADVIREVASERDIELITGIVTAGILLARDAPDRGDLKIINSAIREMRYAFKVFSQYRDARKVTVFGSARSRPGDPDYEQAKAFGEAIARQEWMVVTGAGPGSMAAANEGAGKAASFGVNIRLPFESEPNPFVAEDPKLINFKYFFTRKLMFIKEAEAFVLTPGGFGTMDEAFELLTLTQTGKSDLHPIVLLDPPGGTFWPRWVETIERELLDRGYVSSDDLKLFRITDDVQTAVDEILGFYANYHSMRYVGTKLVLRMRRVPGDGRLAELSEEFSDIILKGGIDRTLPSRGERQDSDALDMQRVSLLFDRTQHGRLRQLIDRLNEA